jgi:hypothetical protein
MKDPQYCTKISSSLHDDDGFPWFHHCGPYKSSCAFVGCTFQQFFSSQYSPFEPTVAAKPNPAIASMAAALPDSISMQALLNQTQDVQNEIMLNQMKLHYPLGPRTSRIVPCRRIRAGISWSIYQKSYPRI